MCGIIGYIGKREASILLLEGLKRLEYRGYDSAGMAVMDGKRLQVVKAVGKVAYLEEKLEKSPIAGSAGIAHTRWATHGKPSEKNAHPHTNSKKDIAIVHNGIIENYGELREELKKEGVVFRSETDSEVIAHLISEGIRSGKSFEEAFRLVLKKLKGTYGIAALRKSEPDTVLIARMGSPLVIGVGKDEWFVASDVAPLLPHTRKVVYLDDGEYAVLTREGYTVHAGGKVSTKEVVNVEWSETEAKHEGYPHFMLKEIYEQPHSLQDALRGRLVVSEGTAKLGGLREVEKRLSGIKRIILVSCGTSYHASLVGEYMLEEFAGIPCEVEFASEFRYRKLILDKQTAVIALSQSGETADTLAAIREAKRQGALVLGIVNTVGSTIARETHAGIYNHAGQEVSVASTKAFTSQLGVLALLTLFLGRKRGLSLSHGKQIAHALEELPKLMGSVLADGKNMKKLAKKFATKKNYLYLGRKYHFPIALEGALKIKEIAYVSAEGYATGEMKHGPIALIDKDSLSVVMVPEDSVYEKNLSGIEEIKARGGAVLAITTMGNTEVAKKADAVVYIPRTLELLTPILAIIPLQLFAYYASVELGYDVDKPRNLAKSVTVE
jgi:glutamine---fructose-6-phosphate transaminase (isomerizing)